MQETDVAEPGRGGRMSRQRKTAAVLRLLRGEDLDTVSRSLGVTTVSPIFLRILVSLVYVNRLVTGSADKGFLMVECRRPSECWRKQKPPRQPANWVRR